MKLAPLILTLFAIPAVAGTLYRWTDAQGNVHYTDQPPPAGAKNATQKDFKNSRPESGVQTAMAQAMLNNPVTLYITENCGIPCEQAKAHLANRGISYSRKDPSASEEDYKALNPVGGAVQAPTLIIGNEKLVGYSEAAWDAALDKAGYPAKTAPANNKP